MVVTPRSGRGNLGSSPSPAARINLASESRKLERAARSAAQGGEAVSWTFLFCKYRFEPKIFWRVGFSGGKRKMRGVLAPPTRARTTYVV